jgi:heme/copper-type cytochrome/quinol oxidase subunit 3
MPSDHLGVAAGAGALLGSGTALGMYALAPGAAPMHWTMVALGTGSLAVVGGLHAAAALRGRGRTADWLVLGYVVAVVLGSSLVLGREAIHTWQELVASNLGAV